MLRQMMLKRIVGQGGLVAIDADGGRHHVPGDADAPLVVRFTSDHVLRRLPLAPILALAEGYMDGLVVIERGTLHEFLDHCAQAVQRPGGAVPGSRPRRILGRLLRRLHQWNPAGTSKRNVARHYDLSGELYRLFLDQDRQYSCAYFPLPGMSLEQAQLAKKRHLAAKLLLRPGQRVLDIGSGWGGLALHLACVGDGEVTGLTLSEEQHRESTRRATALGLEGRVRFRLEDYRATQGSYDRIVSVGMFEHVGLNHYQTFFDKIRGLLTSDGVALVHSIGRIKGPAYTNPFIQKYVFPGGYIPALSEVIPSIERAGLWITDVEILRLHYAETVRAWRERFAASRERAAALYDERFCRMWEFYLAVSEIFFRRQDGMVFQIQLARSRDAVPLARDYIAQAEARMEELRQVG